MVPGKKGRKKACGLFCGSLLSGYFPGTCSSRLCAEDTGMASPALPSRAPRVGEKNSFHTACVLRADERAWQDPPGGGGLRSCSRQSLGSQGRPGSDPQRLG